MAVKEQYFLIQRTIACIVLFQVEIILEKLILTIGHKTGQTQHAQASEKFNYERKMIVGTLCRTRNQFDDQGWHDGPFSTATGFSGESCLTFDPQDENTLYIVYDENAHGIQALDLKKTRDKNSFIHVEIRQS